MKAKFLIIMLIFFAHLSSAQNVQHWVDLGLENSPTTTAQQARIKIAEQAAESAFEWPETQIQFSAIEWMPNDLSPYFRPIISLNQELPWFGTEKAKKQLASAEINSQVAQSKAIEAELSQRIHFQYIELQLLNQKNSFLEKHKENLEAIYDNLLIRLESGQSSAWEIILLENEINQAQAEIKKNEVDFKRQTQNFELLIGSKVENITLDSLETMSLEISEQIRDHPNLLAFQAKREELESEKKLLDITYAPKLSVGIHYESAMPVEPTYLTHDMIMPTFGVSFPLWTNRKKSKQNLVNLQQEAALADMEKEKKRINRELNSKENNLYKIKTDLETYKKNIENIEDALLLLWKEYEADKVSFQEIIRLQSQLLTQNLSQLEAVKDYNQLQSYLKYLSTDTTTIQN